MTNGAVVEFQPATYNITATLVVTNTMTILGNKSILTMAPGLTNRLMDTGTNYGKALLISDLRFNGGNYFQYFASNYFHLEQRTPTFADIGPFFNTSYSNRTGLRAECSGGVTLRDCYFSGFSGNGAIFINVLDEAAFDGNKLILSNCRFSTNFLGCMLAGSTSDVEGYYNAPNDPAVIPEENAEYSSVQGCDFRQNYIGISSAPGNVKIEGNQIVRNWVGLRFAGGGNNTHGSYQMNTINHNNWPIWAQFCNGGGIIANNIFQRNDFVWSTDTTQLKSASGINFDNAQAFMITDNKFDDESFIFTNGCVNVFAHNTFGTNSFWSGSAAVPSIPNQYSNIFTNFDPTVLIYDNRDGYGTNIDGSMGSILAHSTNAPFAGGIAFTPDTTNGAWANQVRITTNGSLAFATNSVMPQPVAGQVIFWYSNYDTWQITPFKTNRIAQGQ